MNAVRQPQENRPSIYARMGQLLGTPIGSEADLLRLTKAGIPARRYLLLAERLRLAPGAIGAESTLRRRVRTLHSAAVQRRGRGKSEAEPRLTPAESERLLRLTRVVSEASELFGDEAAALDWLNTPGDFLHDGSQVTPMKLAETDAGARLVEALIQRTAHGLF